MREGEKFQHHFFGEIDERAENLLGEESTLVRLTWSEYVKIDPTLRKDIREKLAEEDIGKEIDRYRRFILRDRHLSEEYRRNFSGEKLREFAIMNLTLDRFKYPDGRKPTKKELEDNLLRAVFGDKAIENEKPGEK